MVRLASTLITKDHPYIDAAFQRLRLLPDTHSIIARWIAK
jgi:hypothetical protein